MRYFIGKYPLNYAPVANEKILVGFNQYADRTFKSVLNPDSGEYGFLFDTAAMRKPHDALCRLLYPFRSSDSNLLGHCGISTAVIDADEKFNYDFYNEVGYAKVQSARYVDGHGIYEVVTHKSFVKVRTTTWVPQPTGVDAMIRKIEVGTLKRSAAKMEIYPQIHIKGEASEAEGAVIVKQRLYENKEKQDPGQDVFMAIRVKGAEGYFCGAWKRGEEIGQGGAKVVDTLNERPNLTFKVSCEAQPDQWSAPVYLVIGLGASQEEALANLKTVEADKDYCYSSTHQWWEAWHAQGLSLKTDNEVLDENLRVAKTIMRMAFDQKGLTTYIGYQWYQGAVWIRDNSWIAMALSRIGYADDAFRILAGLRDIVQKREDGNFYFIYGCREYQPGDFAWESDSMGLIMTAAGYWFDACKDLAKTADMWEWFSYCADWVCNNLDKDAGLVAADAGIWEDFDEKKGLKREHMVWTSLISAWGVHKVGEMAAALGKTEQAEKYEKVYQTIRDSIEKTCIKDGILVRSPEAVGRNLDSSVLYVWTWTPMLAKSHPALATTMAAMEERIKDPAIGGFWRHENANNDLGDTMPWFSATFWAAEAYAYLGQADKACECLQWALDHSAWDAQMPECMFNDDTPHVCGMSSLSCIGLWGFMAAMLTDPKYLAMLKPVAGEIKATWGK